jgi:hypothetical protein
VAKATAIEPARWVERFSADVSQYGVPIGFRPLLKVWISSITRAIPSGVLKSAVGIPCRTTLCQGSSFWAVLKGTICCHIACFSKRKSAEKALVVVTTRFWPSDLDTVATTGPLIPFSENALLKAFLVARDEKSVLVLETDLTSISRLWAACFAGLRAWALFFFSIIVQSWGLLDLVAPCIATVEVGFPLACFAF